MIKHKDNLAKLLATENVTVQYKNCQTAMFDVQNRVITLPIFKEDLSESLLDLFIGHEVSHALHTPLEGLHETVSNKPVLKGYLNVIEDVRIEKMIKARYPGLKANMKKGYAELMDMDFFGVKKMGDDHVLSLIDKINLTTKVGEFLMLDFTDEERSFLDRAYLVETWDDVVALATEIYEWSEENENKEDDPEQEPEEVEQEDEYGTDQTTGEGEEEGESESSSTEEYGEDDIPEDVESNVPAAGEDARNAMTEEYAHKFEEMELRDNLQNAINIPSDYFDHWKPEHRIQNNDVFIEQIKHYKSENMPMINHITKKLETKNKKVISLMVKEYEIKKAGSLYARARTAKTGAIDTLKLAKYQIVEDMFKRATIIPEGKSHGIVCYIDWSGSMDKVAYSALEQAYIVAKFCRQVGIPHRIFLFTSHSNYDYDSENQIYSEGGQGHMIEVYHNRQTLKQFNDSNLVLSALIAYSCRTDFWNVNKAMRNDFMNDYAPLLEHYESDDRRYVGWMILDELFPYPPNKLRMGGTPLNGLLHTARYLLREQKSQYNLDFQNLILVTDGFSNRLDLPENDYNYRGRGSQRTMFTDPFTKRGYNLRLAGDGMTGTMGMIDYVKQETGASITGYFIVRNKSDFHDFYWHIGWTFERPMSRVFEKANPSDERWAECNKQGGVNFTGTTFDKLLFVKSIHATGDDTLDEGLVGATRGKLKTAFSKNANSKIKSRFIVNQMIEGLQI